MLQLLRLSWSAISTLPFSTDGASCWCKCNESLWSVLTGLHHGMTRVRNVVTGAPGQWLLPEQLSGCSPASAAAATATCFGCSGTHPASSSAQEGQFFARSMHFVISSLAGYISACHALQYALCQRCWHCTLCPTSMCSMTFKWLDSDHSAVWCLLQLQSTGSLAPGTIGKILSGRGVKRGDDISSGGRLSRRNADPIAEAERKAQQEKLYSLDLDRVLAGQCLYITQAP